MVDHGEPPREDVGPTDKALADDISRAIASLQSAMDAAVMAGLVVEPGFMLVENRLNSSGVRADSFVRRVRVFRRLT